MTSRPIVIDGLGMVNTTVGPRMARVVSLSQNRMEIEDLVSGQRVYVDRRHFRPITADDQSRWIAVDMDGTLLQQVEKVGGEPPLGEPIPGAAEFCQALKDMDCRVSIYTARFYFKEEGVETEEEIARIAAHLQQHGIAFDDIYVGRKPPAHAFVDDKGISAVDLGYPEIIARVESMCREAGLDRKARIGIDQAVEKAKTLMQGNILPQDAYQTLYQQLDKMDRYPFAMALMEHGVQVKTGATLPEVRGMKRLVQEGMKTGEWDIRPDDHVDVTINGDSVRISAEAIRNSPCDVVSMAQDKLYQDRQDEIGRDRVSGLLKQLKQAAVLSDRNAVPSVGSTVTGIEFDDVSGDHMCNLQTSDGGHLCAHVTPPKQADVNIIDPPETVDENHRLDWEQEFPAGELLDNESGTMELRGPFREIEGERDWTLTELADGVDEDPVDTPNRQGESFLVGEDEALDSDESMEQEAVSIENLAKDDRHRDPMEGKISMRMTDLEVW